MHVLTGKQTATLKSSCTDEVKEDFQRWWRDRGYPSESACLLELVLVAMHGAEYLTELHRQRIHSLVRNRDESGTTRANGVPEESPR